MSATPHYRAVVIGGGIVGCSVLYHLARMGWADTLLLERRELTSGSTWHAAGNVTYFGHYASLTRLYADSIATYLAAEEESGQPVGFHPDGSLRLATTCEELSAYRRLEPLYRELGIDYRVLARDELNAAHPLLVTDGLHGAAHTPTDGHLDPSAATHALAKCARAAGARIRRRSPVAALARRGDEWEIHISGERETCVRAEHVVVAASFWTRELLAPLGVSLPLYALEHHEIITDTVGELAELATRVPTVRDPAAPANIRQEGDGYLCGVYESQPKLWATGGIPRDFGEELLAPDLARLDAHLLRVGERLPSFATAGVKAVHNGPICYTPDGCPLLGTLAQHPGLWLATGFPVGIGTGGGAGKFLAAWMTGGAPEYDLPMLHPARFSNDIKKSRCLKMIRDTYAAGYAAP